MLWGLGCIGWLFLITKFGVVGTLTELTNNPLYVLAIGPFFSAITGIGFKEFFCFQKIEAIGLTLFIPIALMGHLFGVLPLNFILIILYAAALTLVVLAIRKFGTDAAADIGDKSVFEYLDSKII